MFSMFEIIVEHLRDYLRAFPKLCVSTIFEYCIKDGKTQYIRILGPNHRLCATIVLGMRLSSGLAIIINRGAWDSHTVTIDLTDPQSIDNLESIMGKIAKLSDAELAKLPDAFI